MKENVFDVLIYLFENYIDEDSETNPDPDVIRTELLEAGFPQPEVNQAFEWLEPLGRQREISTAEAPSFRIYSADETHKLDRECRGLLLHLEETGILTSTSRELVIERVTAFATDEISLDNLKWVILMVLFSQPSEEAAFARMEDIVYDVVPIYLH